MSIKKICSKDNINLYKKTDNGIHNFYFEYDIHNDKIFNLLKNDIFKIIFELNKDLIDKMEVICQNSEGGTIILFFKDVLKDIKMKKRFICIHYTVDNRNDNITYKTKELNNDFNFEGYLPIQWKHAEIQFILIQDKINAKCNFLLDEDLDTPIYVENTIGKLIKNVFIKLKYLVHT